MGVLPIVMKFRVENGKYKGNYIVADGNNALLFDPDTVPLKYPAGRQ